MVQFLGKKNITSGSYLHILCLVLIQKQLEDTTMNSQSISLMTAARIKTTHGLTSIAREIEVSAWQCVYAICHCCLTHAVPVLKSLDRSLLTTKFIAHGYMTVVCM